MERRRGSGVDTEEQQGMVSEQVEWDLLGAKMRRGGALLTFNPGPYRPRV